MATDRQSPTEADYHYLRAQMLLEEAETASAEEAAVLAVRAQAHATLALAQATASPGRLDPTRARADGAPRVHPTPLGMKRPYYM